MNELTSTETVQGMGTVEPAIRVPFDVFINDHFAATIEADNRPAAEKQAKLRYGCWLEDILRIVDRYGL